MSLHSWTVLLALAGSAAVAGSGKESAHHRQRLSFTNSDRTTLEAVQVPRASGYRLRLRTAAGIKSLAVLQPENAEDADVFRLRLTDINLDGFGDVESQGQCGNRACRKQIFLFDPSRQRLALLFGGEYSTAQIREGYLVIGAGSGCCAHEFRLFRMGSNGLSVDSVADYLVTVQSRHGDEKDHLECAFVDKQGQPARPPTLGALSLCQVLGRDYRLTSPPTQADGVSLNNVRSERSLDRPGAPRAFHRRPGPAEGALHVQVTERKSGSVVFDQTLLTALDTAALEAWLGRVRAPSRATAQAYAEPFVVDDPNCDGYLDFSVVSLMGNVQINRQVFLFDPPSHRFVEHEGLGQVACLRVDAARRQLHGECFHSSAANHWVERYTMADTTLRLLSRRGIDDRADGETTWLFSFDSRFVRVREVRRVLRCEREEAGADGQARRQTMPASLCEQRLTSG